MSLSFDISFQHRDNEFHDSRVLDMLFSHPYFTLYFILAFLFIMWETTKGTINDEKDTNIIREKALVQSEDTMYFTQVAGASRYLNFGLQSRNLYFWKAYR